MRRILLSTLMLVGSLGLAACDSKSEDKAQQAEHHAEQAQDNMKDAAKEQAKADKAAAESKAAAADEAKTFVPTSEVPKSIETPAKN